MELFFSVDGKPTPKQSVRGSKFRKYYQPKDLVDRAQEVRWEIKRSLPRGFKIITGGVHTELTLIYEWPKGTSKKVRESGKRVYKTTRPDNDNLQKFLYDTLNGIVLKDDALIASWAGVKIYGDKAGAKIYVREL